MMAQEHVVPMWKRIFRGAVWTGGTIFAAMALVLLILLPVSADKERAAEKRWADAGLPISDFAKKYPVQEDSHEALALEAEALQLGFSLRSTGSNIVSRENANAWNSIREALNDYLRILESPEPPLAWPPEALARFLSSNGATISDLRERLNRATPLWKMDVGKGYAFPIPNLLGQFDLAKLLSADCLAARAGGDNDRALKDADAIWRLSDGLVQRPELISQLIAIAIRKTDLAELRTLQDAPSVWSDRLTSWNPRKNLETSYQHEASMMNDSFKALRLGTPYGQCPSWKDRVMAPFSLIYARFCVAGVENIFLDSLRHMQETDICSRDEVFQRIGELDEKEIPRWNVIAKVGVPNLTDAWLRVKYLRIQIELTQKVLELKATRSANGAWPVQVPGIEKSFCPQEHWTYTVMPDGTMSIAYSGTPPGEKVVKGFRPPQEYEEGPPANAK